MPVSRKVYARVLLLGPGKSEPMLFNKASNGVYGAKLTIKRCSARPAKCLTITSACGCG